MATQPNTPAPAPVATTTTAPKAPKLAAPAAATLPPANVVAAPAKGRTVTVAAVVGGSYAVQCAAPNGSGAPGQPATVTLPYSVPPWAGATGAPVTLAVCSVAPNWLGTNGLPLLATAYASAGGTVVVQRHPGGCKVTAYPAGMAGCGLTMVAL